MSTPDLSREEAEKAYAEWLGAGNYDAGYKETWLAAWHRARAAAMRECWSAVNAKIVAGHLEGDGSDKAAERNGLIWATNIIRSLSQQEDGK